MLENINEELEKLLFKANVTKEINTMLECLLSKDERWNQYLYIVITREKKLI
jgi:hypothetical protein